MTPKTLIAILASGVVVVRAVAEARAVKVREEAKRAEIKAESQLKIKAINAAERAVADMINSGQIRSLDELRDAVSNEIAFQTIVHHEK